MTDPPTLFPLGLLEPIDPSSQLDRLPGVDAPCFCGRDECRFAFCEWKDHLPDRPPYERKDAA